VDSKVLISDWLISSVYTLCTSSRAYKFIIASNKIPSWIRPMSMFNY